LAEAETNVIETLPVTFFFFMDKIYIYGTVIFLFTEQSFLKLGLLQIQSAISSAVRYGTL